MTKIVVAHSGILDENGNSITPCYYEGFIRSLIRSGNDVLHIITNDFIKTPWNGTNEIHSRRAKKNTLQKIIEYSPDIVFTFNNSNIAGIEDALDVPIVVMQADAPIFYNDKENLKRNVDRYHFVSSNELLLNQIQQSFNAKRKNLHISHFATDFSDEKCDMDKNISFIGSNFLPYFSMDGSLPMKHLDELREVYSRIKKTSFEDYFAEQNADASEDNRKSDDSITSILVGHQRRRILEAVCELGLTVYGTKNWLSLIDSSLDLALSYNSQEIYSVQHNQDVYNSSKICINISHPQAVESFPWRVMDIAATNACLVSDPKKDMLEFFKPYVHIPTYENKSDAYAVCKKLLDDPAWRDELVQGAQLCIKEKGRFEYRFKELEQFFGIKLLSDKKGTYERLQREKNNLNFKVKKQLIYTVPTVFFPYIHRVVKIFGLSIDAKLIHHAKNRYYSL